MRLSLVGEVARRFARRAKADGLAVALKAGARRALGYPPESTPLARVDRAALFSVGQDAIRAAEVRRMRATAMLYDASHVEATYPLIFETDGRYMRYAFLPAKSESKGLAVYFHGHNAFLHLGPLTNWTHFDVLAPWDTFGWHRQGSWFWGERGNNFVEPIVQGLIRKHRESEQQRPWFCVGVSMGGFGALYHGIKYHCDGMYVMAPQVDLRAKITDYGKDDRDNPYGYLRGETLDTVPDLFALCEHEETLPPLFLVQQQFDSVNFFADHAYRLLDVYNRKHAWYGLRVHPAIGHGGDGSQEEAELFFSLIVEKNPPRQVDFRSQT